MAPPIQILPFTPPWISQLRQFNERLLAAGLQKDLCFPDDPATEMPPDGSGLFQEYYLAAEQDPPAVRGAFWLTFETWRHNGEPLSVSHYRLPVSEGIADRQ